MYESSGEHLQSEFDRLERLLERAVATRNEQPSNHEGPDRGISIETFGDARQRTDDSHREPDEHTDLGGLAEQINENVATARERGIELRLDTLARTFDLSRTDLDALLVVLAPEFDPSLTVTYGQIAGFNQRQFPTIGIVKRILAGRDDDAVPTDTSSTPAAALAPSAPLFEHAILERADRTAGHPVNATTLSVAERIVRYLEGDDTLDSALHDVATVEHHERTLSELVFDDETTTTLETIADRSSEADAPTIYHFSGEDGTGTDRLPGALTDAETPILRTEAVDVLEDDALTTRLIREAALQDAAIHLEGLEAVTGRDEGPTLDEDGGDLEITTDDGLSVDAVVERLDDATGDVFCSHTEPWKPDVDLESHRVETAHCPFPDYDTRVTIWEEYREEVADEYLLESVAANFRLPQRDVRRAVKTARYLCRTDADGADLGSVEVPDANADATGENEPGEDVFAPVDAALERAHLYEACKRYSASNLEALAESMEPGYTFEDIYLNDKPKTHLRELCGHLQYRGQVTSEWGFGEPGDRGDGVVAMFYGPPGTGKTMAAEIIANETGLDLYRVDLSQIVNKYIGETESRLAALLEEAERSNAILLFDEADSLFGERTDVGDSTDRYANNVTNFLLQRLETFGGIALLTTNKRSGIDPAFKRRIAHSILFDVPQERVRRQIWRDVFPDEASVDTSDFDYEFLGRLVVTPAVVRKIAKYAAYIAATESHDGHPFSDSQADFADVTITFDHVILALQYATEAGGVAIEQDFLQYEDKLRSYENQRVSREWEDALSRKYGNETDTDSSGPEDGLDGDSDADAGFLESNADTPSNKRTASSVDPADGRSTEAVVCEFVSRLADGDHSAHELYHPRASADKFTSKELAMLEHGELAIGSDIERVRDASDRVVLEFDQELNTEDIPERVDGVPANATYELRPVEGEGWRIFSISER